MPKLPKKKQTVSTNMILHTRNCGHECKLNWIIENVLQFPNEELSSKLDLGRSCRTRLDVIVKVRYKNHFTVITIRLQRADHKDRDIKVLCDISIKNSKGDVYNRTKSSLVFEKLKTDSESHWLTEVKFADLDYVTNTVTESELKGDNDRLRKLVSKGLLVWDEAKRNILFSLLGHSITVEGTIKVFACCVNLKSTPINKNRSREV
ncbi:BTB domain-containing protein, partial [Nephila pilipes]